MLKLFFIQSETACEIFGFLSQKLSILFNKITRNKQGKMARDFYQASQKKYLGCKK
jgi:hypothetical protein